MCPSSNDKLYSANTGSIITEKDRKIFENKNTRKLVDIPRTLFNELKEFMYSLTSQNIYHISESMIIRVGTRIVLDSLPSIVLQFITSEEKLLGAIRKFYGIAGKVKEEATKEILYSRNYASITQTQDKVKRAYDDYSERKHIHLPYKLFADVKDARVELERVIGPGISENTFYRLGLIIMLDILPHMDLGSINTEEMLYDYIKNKFSTI